MALVDDNVIIILVLGGWSGLGDALLLIDQLIKLPVLGSSAATYLQRPTASKYAGDCCDSDPVGQAHSIIGCNGLMAMTNVL